MLRNWKAFDQKLCKKGGGGGGSSGAVSHSAYLETIHSDWLDNTGVDTVTSSITDLINVGFGDNPYTIDVAYDPDTPIAAMQTELGDLNTLIDLLSAGTGLDALVSNILDDTRIDDSVTEFSADLGARLTAEVLPRFQAGMRDINAVVSSAFVIGQAVLEDGNTRQVAKYSADLHMKAWGDDALRLIALKIEGQKALTHYAAEINRLNIVAKKEETDVNAEIDVKDSLWDLELFQYGGNLLASISGGVMVPKQDSPSKTQSAIGGALTGAATGAMIGSAVPAVGTAIGAGVGAVLGAAQAFL